MTVICLLSQTNNDLLCPVCGEAFRIFAENTSATVREQVKRRVQRAIRSHHAGSRGALAVHPTTAFPIEDENAGLGDGFNGWLPVMQTAAMAC